MRVFYLVLLAVIFTAQSVRSGPISFTSGWVEQRFSLFSSNDFRFGSALKMGSDGSVSLVWRKVPAQDHKATKARWEWSVDQSVPPTDLRQKGEDDRNIALYFVFVDEQEVERLSGASILKLLKSDSVRVLLYTWGGDHKRGAKFLSPYMRGKGQNIILRRAQTGSFKESVNLEKDFKQAFGERATSLVGIAVSGDSDDTDTVIAAQINALVLQ